MSSPSASPSPTAAPVSQVTVTPDDRGPAINIVAWVTMCAMILSVFTKLTTKYERSRKLMSDDLLAVLAMLFAVAETIAVSVGVSHGLGKKQALISSKDLLDVQRAQYASEFMLILGLAFSQLVTVRFVSMLAPFTHVLRFVYATYIATAVWAFVSIFGIAFQCPTPRTYTVFSDKCFDQLAFWIAMGVIQAVIEIALVVLPIFVLRPIDLDKASKTSVLFAFSARILMVPVIIIRLVYIHYARSRPDRSFNEYGAFMATQVLLNLSIVLACFPFLKTFIDSMQGGFLTADFVNGPAIFSSVGSRTGGGNYSLNMFSNKNSRNDNSQMMGSQHARTASEHPIKEPRDSSNNSDNGSADIDRSVAVETTVTVHHEDTNTAVSGSESRTNNENQRYEEGIKNALTGWK